jgi:hypothetical protein
MKEKNPGSRFIGCLEADQIIRKTAVTDLERIFFQGYSASLSNRENTARHHTPLFLHQPPPALPKYTSRPLTKPWWFRIS